MEKIPKLNIGDQKFQKVGKMESEPTKSKHSPESYDLYQDTKSGTLMGKLPEDHPVIELIQKLNPEAREQLEAMDLTKLTVSEAASLLRPSYDMFEKRRENWDNKIYGRINRGDKKELLLSRGALDSTSIFYKEDVEEYRRTDGVTHRGVDSISFHDLDYLPHVWGVQNLTISGRNSLVIKEGKNTAEVSFLEVPKAYTELMEKKEGKTKKTK